MTLRVCAELGCGEYTTTTRCSRHEMERKRKIDKRRPSASQRGYGAGWRKIRSTFLKANSVCIDCGKEATVPDHAPWTRKQLLERGVANPDLPIFLQPRCKDCHDRKTATEDGGFGRQPVERP